jgi:hypothetical protein
MDFTNLDKEIAYFRKSSPHIAAAFDETKKLFIAHDQRIAALEVLTAPPPTPDPIPPTTGPALLGWDKSLRPAFTPKRTVTTATRSGYDAAMSALQPGDLLLVQGVKFTGQTEIRRALPDWAEVHFDAACSFSHNADYFTLWFVDAAFLRVYMDGCLVSNTGNPGVGRTREGIRAEQCHDIVCWGYHIKGCNGTGLEIHEGRTTGGTTARLDFRGEIEQCGLDIQIDGHAEHGTGLHGFYLGSGNGWVEDCVFSHLVHDQPSGAAMEHGPNTRRIKTYLDARRCSFVAQMQVGGLAYSVWAGGAGPGQSQACTVEYLYAEDCAGRAVEMSGLNGSPAYTINYARQKNTKGYVQSPSIRYLDAA